MSGRRQKPPDALVNKRGGRYRPLTLIPGTRLAPPCPPRMRKYAREAWATLWASPLAQAYGDESIPALERWVFYLNEWDKTTAEVRTGYGALRDLSKLESALRSLEVAFGLDPLSRLRLGLSVAGEQSPVSELKEPQQPPQEVSV